MPIDRAATPDSTTPASNSISTAANVSLPGITGDIHLPPPAHYAPLPIDGRPWKGPPAPAPVPTTPPPTGPSPGRYSPTLKAFAFALRPFLTLDEDLHATKQVMLVGSPLQYGIPTSLDDAEYLNEALFSVADPIQPEGTPVFSTRGVSYFEWLRAYVRNVEDTSRANPAEVQKASKEYQAAAHVADLRFNKMLKQFTAVAKADPKVNFLEWTNSAFGDEYRAACDTRDAKAARLKEVQGRELSDVNRVRAMLDSARDHLELKKGNNMPCALRDRPTHPTEVDKTYLPLHYLSGYESASNDWIMGTSPSKTRSFSFSPLFSGSSADGHEQHKTWSQLGLNHVEDEKLDDVPVWMKDVVIEIKYRGMQAFDIHRGLWDVSGLKTVLPPISEDSVLPLRRPTLKTKKLLLAYGVELVVRLPPEVAKALRSEPTDGEANISILPEVLGGLGVTWGKDGVLEATVAKQNGYSVLLGVLAEWVNVGE
ncbi:hypothetical protein LRP88_11386 [Fusarium phalaenopsidis]